MTVTLRKMLGLALASLTLCGPALAQEAGPRDSGSRDLATEPELIDLRALQNPRLPVEELQAIFERASADPLRALPSLLAGLRSDQPGVRIASCELLLSFVRRDPSSPLAHLVTFQIIEVADRLTPLEQSLDLLHALAVTRESKTPWAISLDISGSRTNSLRPLLEKWSCRRMLATLERLNRFAACPPEQKEQAYREVAALPGGGERLAALVAFFMEAEALSRDPEALIAKGQALRSRFAGLGQGRVELIMGRAYYALHRFNEAFQAFEAALALNPFLPPALANLASLERRQGRYSEALTLLSRAILIEPARSILYRLRAETRWDAARSEHKPYEDESFDAVLLDLNRCIELNPTDGEAFGRRGFLLTRRSDFVRALSDLDMALKLDVPQRAWLWRGERGLLHARRQRYAEALEDLRAFKSGAPPGHPLTESVDEAIALSEKNLGATPSPDSKPERPKARLY